MLRDLAELTMLDEGDPQSFRVRAYESAAQAVAAQANDLGTLTAKGPGEDRGIGRARRRRSVSCSRDRKVEKLEALREAPVTTVVALLRIPARAQGREEAARRAAHRVGGRPPPRSPGTNCASCRASARSPEEARAALACPRRAGRRRLHADLGRAAAREPHRRAPAREVKNVRHANSAARCAASPGDHRRRRRSRRRDRSRAGDGRAHRHDHARRPRARTWRCEDQHRHGAARVDRSARGRTAPARRGAALYFTGSKARNISSCASARSRAATLNEYALSRIDGGDIVASEIEAQIYEALSGCRGSRQCCARTRARSRPPRKACCRHRSAT